MAARSKPHRTHSLGGCFTCQRRHVKYNQDRPACLTCSSMGFRCEGYPDGLRWMSDKKCGKPEEHLEKNGTRHHLYTEQSRLSMSIALRKSLVSGSVDASLDEIDSSSLLSDGDVRAGPFAVLKPTPSPSDRVSQTSGGAEGTVESTASNVETIALPTPATPLAFENLPPFPDDLLQWPDLFGLDDDLYGLTSNLPLSLHQDTDSTSYPFGNETCDAFWSASLDTAPGFTEHNDKPNSPGAEVVPAESSATRLGERDTVLAEAPFLLNIFQTHVVPRLTVVPLGQKTPWNILSIPAAIGTLGDITILNSPDVNHARQANLYSLLACAAYYLAMTPQQLSASAPAKHWAQIAVRSYRETQSHLRISLIQETGGPRKAKYKEQLMAVFGIMECAIFQGLRQDARCYILDAERLLRLRGLPKRRTSHKTRLLVNVYTWLRIVGESTYVLHDYSAPDAFIKTLSHQIDICESSSQNTASGSITERDIRLDDFLHIDSLDNNLDIDDPKDERKDITDIHLQDSRKSLYTLGKQVYGISETWLSLVSQTTRLANVLEKLRTAQTSELPIESKVWNFLQERSDRLENVIHSYASREPDADATMAPSSPDAHILQALNAALVILFYRRVRRVHPVILESQVEKVVLALESINMESYHIGPGFLWPVFLAGCEATKKAHQDSILRLIGEAKKQCCLAPFILAGDIMAELWLMRDEHSPVNQRESLPTWIDILKQQQIGPMFC